jgi:hypothetical protein
MQVIKTEIPDVLIIEPKVFGDDRGFFFESYNERAWQLATGLQRHFVQDTPVLKRASCGGCIISSSSRRANLYALSWAKYLMWP